MLLIQRPENDPFWAGQRPSLLPTSTPNSFDDVKERVFQELNYSADTGSDAIYASTELKRWKRGMVISIYHYLELEETSGVGKFFPVDELPENIVENQAEMIGKIAKMYKSSMARSVSDSGSI
ncbi:MAG: hypothetical protein ACK4NC_01620 [Candidatus Gracilibacteria bacterium]